MTLRHPAVSLPIAQRRRLLSALAAAPLVLATTGCSTAAARADREAQAALQALDDRFDGRLGVFALDTGSGATLGHRGGERFPMCSSFKAVLAASMLARSSRQPDWLAHRVRYAKADLVSYSPITERHVGEGMTVAELCAATVQYSDNGAANLLMAQSGGPQALTAFARSQGDSTFRLDRIEPALNSAIPGDERDTTTPEAMARLLQRLVLGEGLTPQERQQLADWLRGNTTGARRIRAGVPAVWTVGDKTGTGAHGSASDIGIVWRPGAAPLALAIYTTRPAADAPADEAVIAEAARIVAAWAGAGSRA
ncbi:MAG: class A beta-lactamase [Pseudacidovorax sp.]|nr:class A beta-lactamase [Pseudacidovorax sp.]